MKLRIKNTLLTLKIIGWVQIIGGITGLLLVCHSLLQTEIINGPTLLIFLIGLSLFIFSVYAGNILLSKINKKRGIVLTVINQILQLFQWSMLGYSFNYSSGIELMIGLKAHSVNFNFGLVLSTFSMSINSSSQFYFKINLIPILAIIVLVNIFSEISGSHK